MMKTFESDIVRIEQKLKLLVEEVQHLRQEKVTLNAEIVDLRERLSGQKNKIKELDETNKIVKLADGIKNRLVDDNDIKIRINEYIREIDRCIAILSD